MSDLTWVRPESVGELAHRLSREGVIPHGGGTGLLSRRLDGAVLADLSALGLEYLEQGESSLEIGAMVTYTRLVEHLRAEAPDHVLRKSLEHAASSPLRNRITIGGSVSMSPLWSSLMGPLVALEATVHLVGAEQRSFPITEYLSEPRLRKHTAVTGVTVPIDPQWSSRYARFVRTRFDYPLFTTTILLKEEAGVVVGARLVVTGTKRRYARLTELEERLTGATLSGIRIAPEDLGVRMPARQGYSEEYLLHRAAVEIERGLEGLAVKSGDAKGAEA
jgi:CO/xanthine dehydrogenase FAD-binding subunit